MRALLLGLLLLAGGLGRGEQTDKAIPQIQVTRTWGDLLESEPLIVETDKAIFADSSPTTTGKPVSVSVRVGIDRDHSASDGAVVLYCLAKGVSFSRTSEDDLGPFQVHVLVPHLAPKLADLQQALSEGQSALHSNYALFTRSVPVRNPGNYHIELLQPPSVGSKAEPKILAKIEIRVSGKPVLPWSPWGDPDEASAQASLAPSEDNSSLAATVSNPVGGIAIPKTPTGFVLYPEVPARKTPLPQLIPNRPDPQTQLTLADNALLVTLPGKFAFDDPEDDFLTRWWVNDKPFVPDPTLMEDHALQQAEAMQEAWINNVRFALEFRPERLNAKKGDKIGVQILFCPNGWKACEKQLAVVLNEAQLATPHPLSNLSFPSNRIDFIYSGDPKNFQQK